MAIKTQKELKVVLLIVAGLAFIYIVNLFISILIRPSGPYEPLASTEFFFDKTGAQKELHFKPRFSIQPTVILMWFLLYTTASADDVRRIN